MQALHNLALLYRNNGRWSEAEATYERAVGVWTKTGDKHIIASLRDYAQLYVRKGDLATAKKTMKRGEYPSTLSFQSRSIDLGFGF